MLCIRIPFLNQETCFLKGHLARMDSCRTHASPKEGNDEQEWTCLDLADASKPTAWGRVIGHGLRSAQFHSTLSGELMVCLAIDPQARCLALNRNSQHPSWFFQWA